MKSNDSTTFSRKLYGLFAVIFALGAAGILTVLMEKVSYTSTETIAGALLFMLIGMAGICFTFGYNRGKKTGQAEGFKEGRLSVIES